MIIQRLRYKNILSTGNNWIDINFTDVKTTLIFGENGCGKSTAIQSLCFCLYGKDFRGVKKSGLINSINNKQLVTECWFEKNGNQYLVKRGIKPDIFEIYRNGILLDADGKKLDQQKTFEEEILQFPYNSFKQIVVTGSGQYIPFMKLTTPNRREFLESLLEIDVFSKMQLLLKDKILSNNSELSASKSDISLLVEKIKFIQNKLNEDKNSSEKIISEYSYKIQELIVKIQKSENQFEVIRKLIDEIDLKLKKFDAFKDLKIKFENQIYAINNENSQQQFKIDKIDKLEKCTTCFQLVDDTHKKFICEETTQKITENEIKLSDIKTKLDKIFSALEIKEKLLDEKNTHSYTLNDISNEIKTNNSLIMEYSNIIDANKNKHKQSDLELDDFMKNLNHEKKKYDEFSTLQNIYSSATLLLKDNGIKSIILKKYVDMINVLVNQYLEKFEFYVQFTLDENFNEIIKSRYRDEFSYENFSEGEKARIDLALLFT